MAPFRFVVGGPCSASVTRSISFFFFPSPHAVIFRLSSGTVSLSVDDVSRHVVNKSPSSIYTVAGRAPGCTRYGFHGKVSLFKASKSTPQCGEVSNCVYLTFLDGGRGGGVSRTFVPFV